jgi:hypothetical protein
MIALEAQFMKHDLKKQSQFAGSPNDLNFNINKGLRKNRRFAGCEKQSQSQAGRLLMDRKKHK